MSAAEIAARCGLAARSRAGLRRLLRQWVDEGRLIALRDKRFASNRKLGDVTGRFSRHPAGFGFVVPDDPQQEDLFIPPPAQAGAVHGDLVAARVVDVRYDGKREGRVVRVLSGSLRTLLGTYRKAAGGAGVVDPLDAGYGFGVLVRKEDSGQAQSGEVVRVALTSTPRADEQAFGKVLERLGHPEEPGVDVAILIRKYGFATEFPEAVQREVDRLPGTSDRWLLETREDFTGETVVTIDGETAKDFDDAICVTRLAGGGFRLQVHIADVAWFVSEESELDTEAQRRATSVYFPGRCVPMLPERLSNDLCSLRPDEIRLTQGTSIDYDKSGKVLGARFHDGFIRSKARLTYEEVAKIIELREPAAREARRSLVPMLDAAAELAALLAQRRKQRGAIDFDLPEPEILFDLTGKATDIVARSRNAAHRLIEEFMLAANEVVAAELKRKREPTLYRAHEKPDVGRVMRSAELLAGLGYEIPEPYDQIRPAHLAALVNAAKGRPEEPFVARVVLRTMALARYDEHCLGHFGLALRNYLHFTSPIRRYPDLVAHRALRRLRHNLRGSAAEREERAARLADSALECSRLEREAEAAERESIAWKKAVYMSTRIGDEFPGTVVDVSRNGLLVAVADPYFEGLVPIARMGTEFWKHDPKRHLIRGAETGATFKLGQRVDVFVERVDALRHLIDLGLVGARESEPRRRGDRSKKPGSRSGAAKSTRGERTRKQPRRGRR
ncbi:MAG: ribonuclease R [Acidobacteriota bacterium]